MFPALKVKNFRIYWFGMLVSLVGTWIQTVAQSWLVFKLTDSALLLGLVSFLNLLPVFLLSLFSGVLIDRVDKKAMLLFTQISFMVLAFVLAILVQLDIITPYQIMVISLFNGIIMAFDGPTRQAIVIELAGRDYLLNAIALNSAAFNIARIVGPALAALFIASIGMSGCFYLNGISFIAVILALFTIEIEKRYHRETRKHFIAELLEGLKFILTHKVVLSLIITVGIMSLFGVSYLILMPVFADRVLRVGVKGLGMLMSAIGAGAVISALFLAKMSHRHNKGRLLVIATVVYSLLLLIFSLSKSYIFSIVLLIFMGATNVMGMSLVNTILQEIVPDEFRGRLMSMFMFTFAGLMPIGNLFAGWLADLYGVSFTMLLGGIICSILFTINIFKSKMYRLA
jgi:MFS family permease